MPERPAPPVRDGRVAEAREQVDEHAVQLVEDGRLAVELRLDRRPEVVRRSAPAEGEPSVGRALPVDDEVPLVGERRARRHADLVPERLGQRLRGEHQRVDGDDVALEAGQLGGVALGGADAERRPHRAVPRPDDAGLDRRDLGALVDRDPEPLDDLREATREPGRVDRRRVRREGRAQHLGGAHGRLGLRGRQPAVVVLAEAPRARVGDLGLGALASCTGVRASVVVPPLAQWTSSPSAATTEPTSSTVANIARCMATAASRAGLLGDLAPRGGEQRRAPATVAPGGAETGDLALEDDDAQGRVGLGQVVRRPEPGVARADDDDVGLAVPGQGGRCGPTSSSGRVAHHSESSLRSVGSLIGSRSRRRAASRCPGPGCPRPPDWPYASRIGTRPAHAGPAMSSSGSSGWPSLTLTDASARDSERIVVAATSFLCGARTSSQRPGIRCSVMVRSASRLAVPVMTVHVPSTMTAAVVHGRLEGRARHDEAVEQGDGEAGRCTRPRAPGTAATRSSRGTARGRRRGRRRPGRRTAGRRRRRRRERPAQRRGRRAAPSGRGRPSPGSGGSACAGSSRERSVVRGSTTPRSARCAASAR